MVTIVSISLGRIDFCVDGRQYIFDKEDDTISVGYSRDNKVYKSDILDFQEFMDNNHTELKFIEEFLDNNKMTPKKR